MTTAQQSLVILPTKEEILAATDQATRRLLVDLYVVPPEAWGNKACGDWTVDETVAHLALGPIAYAVILDQMVEGGQEELFDVTDPEFVDSQKELMGEATPTERMESVAGALGQFNEAGWGVPDEKLTELTWTPEAIMPTGAALGIALNELVVHGYEVRVATGLDDPLPAGADPTALAAFALYACTGLVRSGGWAPVEVAIGSAKPVVFSWDGEKNVMSAPGDSSPEARLQCGPGVFALLLWGRITVDEAREKFGLTVEGPVDTVESFFAAARTF